MFQGLKTRYFAFILKFVIKQTYETGLKTGNIWRNLEARKHKVEVLFFKIKNHFNLIIIFHFNYFRNKIMILLMMKF